MVLEARFCPNLNGAGGKILSEPIKWCFIVIQSAMETPQFYSLFSSEEKFCIGIYLLQVVRPTLKIFLFPLT